MHCVRRSFGLSLDNRRSPKPRPSGGLAEWLDGMQTDRETERLEATIPVARVRKMRRP
jgi:hypothetical protein